MAEDDDSIYEAVFESIRLVMEEKAEQLFEGVLRSKSERVYAWKSDSPIMSGNKYIYPVGRFRFIQKFEFEGLQYPVIYLQDSSLYDIVGIQMGIIVESPIPRGLVILPKDIIPLELEKEERRSYMNPLYALMRKERENEGNSTFMKSLKELSDGYQMIKDVSTSFLTQVFLGKYGREAELKVTYPRYLVMYPVGNRTIVVVSTAVSKREFVARKIQGPDGKSVKIRVTVPNDKFSKKVFEIIRGASKIIEENRCDYSVFSKEPDLIPLLKYLVRVSAQSDIIYDLNDAHELTQENLEVASRELPLLHSRDKAGVWEIAGLPSIRGSLNSRYATLTIKCPKCNALYNYSHTKVPEDGMLQCNNCLHEFQGVDLGPNY